MLVTTESWFREAIRAVLAERQELAEPNLGCQPKMKSSRFVLFCFVTRDQTHNLALARQPLMPL